MSEVTEVEVLKSAGMKCKCVDQRCLKAEFLLYLSSPPHTFPDAEVDEHPGDSQRNGQRHSHLSWLVQAISHLMHITPSRAHVNNHHCMHAKDLDTVLVLTALYM